METVTKKYCITCEQKHEPTASCNSGWISELHALKLENAGLKTELRRAYRAHLYSLSIGHQSFTTTVETEALKDSIRRLDALNPAPGKVGA